jgi:acyl carrier protein
MKREDGRGEEVLVCYYVSRQEVEWEELREVVRERVVEEVVPTVYVQLRKMPLTLNGKVNYEALPGLEEVRGRRRQEYVGARTAVEEEVVRIWEEVLGVEQVGVNDNFFELGGHSLLMVKVFEKLRERFNKQLEIVDLFKYPTVSALAKFIAEGSGEDTATPEEPARAEPYSESAKRQGRIRERRRAMAGDQEVSDEL